MNPAAATKKLRALSMALPEVVETVTWGHPTWLVGKKAFVVIEPYKGEYAIAFKATVADQTALTMDPRFYATPYTGKHGWTSLRLTERVDWREVRALVESAYRLVAPKRMLAKLDASSALPEPAPPTARAQRLSRKPTAKRRPRTS